MSQLNVDKIVSLSGGGSTAEFQLASNGNFNLTLVHFILTQQIIE